MKKNDFQLSNVLAILRDELRDAHAEGKGSDLRLRIDEVEVELQVVTTKEGGAKGGATFLVFNAETHGKLSASAVHKLRLRLKPMKRDSDEEYDVERGGKKPR